MIPYNIPAEPGCYTVIYELKDGSTESRDVWLWPEQKVQGRPVSTARQCCERTPPCRGRGSRSGRSSAWICRQ